MTNAHRILSVLFVLIGLLLVGCGAAGPADTVEDFYTYVEAGEVDAAADLFSDQITALIPRDKLKTGLAEQTREMKEKDGISSFEVLSEDITGEERTSLLFVANHAFDCIGAKSYGMRTTFIDRRKRPFGETPHQPDIIVKDFAELAEVMT